MKYIDADLLRKEIERRLKYTHDWLRGDEKRHPNQTFISKNYYKMKGDERTLDALLNFIDSLQQEQQEVDLDKEMEKFGERWPYPVSFDGYDKDWVDELTEECAKHFYELGKNSK